MRPPLEVTINGPRGEGWERVCGTRRFPVTTWEPMTADLPGKPGASIYLLNMRLMPTDTVKKIAAHCAQKFGGSVADVEREMIEKGMPILADDCTVVLNDPQRWIG